MKIDPDSAQVRIPPPLLLLACIGAGWGLGKLYPIHFFPISLRMSLRWSLGSVLIALGIGIIFFSSRLFRKAETDIRPWKATSRLVLKGPYRLSRNPIYAAFLLLNLGIAFATNNTWGLLMTLPLIGLLDRFVIAREERYLEAKFGDEYRAYKARVRRWI